MDALELLPFAGVLIAILASTWKLSTRLGKIETAIAIISTKAVDMERRVTRVETACASPTS